MKSPELLSTIAEVSIAFAGFTALISVLLRRADEGRVRRSLHRLQVVLMRSLFATFFSLLPLVPFGIGLSIEASWYLSSGAFLVVIAVYDRTMMRRVRSLQGEGVLPTSTPVLWTLRTIHYSSMALLLLCATTLLADATPGAYVAVLLAQLVVAGVHFARIFGEVASAPEEA